MPELLAHGIALVAPTECVTHAGSERTMGYCLPEAQEAADVLVLLLRRDFEAGHLVVRTVLSAHLGKLLDRLEAGHLAFEQEDVVLGDAGVLGGLQRDLDARGRRRKELGIGDLECVRHFLDVVRRRGAGHHAACRFISTSTRRASGCGARHGAAGRDATGAVSLTDTDGGEHSDGIPDGVSAEEGEGLAGLVAVLLDESGGDVLGGVAHVLPIEALAGGGVMVAGQLIGGQARDWRGGGVKEPVPDGDLRRYC